MPPTICSFSGLTIYTGDSNFNQVEITTSATITNSLPGNDATAVSASIAKIISYNVVSATSSTYQFTIYTTGDLPMYSYFTLYIPTSIGVPGDLILNCLNLCTTS
jgi:hypothetical protein